MTGQVTGPRGRTYSGGIRMQKKTIWGAKGLDLFSRTSPTMSLYSAVLGCVAVNHLVQSVE